MDSLEMILPDIWKEALLNKEKITDKDAISFGKENLLYLVKDFEGFLSSQKSSMTNVIQEHFIDAIARMRIYSYKADSRPLFSFYRDYNFFKKGDVVFIFNQNYFHRCTVLKVEENVANIVVEPKWNDFDFEMLARLPLIKSPCMLNEKDFTYMIENPEYAKIWFEAGYKSMPMFNKYTLLSNLLSYKQ